jgi:hypothetical protein
MSEYGIRTHSLDTSNPRSSPCAWQRDKPDFSPLYLLIQSAKPASLHTQTTKECQGKRSLKGIMAIISKIWSQSALELDLSLRCLVLDVVPGARARTGVRPSTPRALVRAPPTAVLTRAYKASPGAPHLAPCSPSPARRPSLAPTSSLPLAIATRASATAANPLQSLRSRASRSNCFAKSL